MISRFWEIKELQQMTPTEWESLCDGCGRCCLVKLEDDETGEIYYTDVSCRLLNIDSCRCGNYANRKQVVPTCFVLTAGTIESYSYLPPTCAYRLLSEDKPLPAWHPLLTGDPGSVHAAGISVKSRVESEEHVLESEFEEHVVYWPLAGK